MRRILTSVVTIVVAVTLGSSGVAARDIFDGGRLGGISSQLDLPVLSKVNGNLEENATPVDLEKFAGTWFQVAAIPQPFTLQCARDTKAQYKVIEDSTISVTNSCETFLGDDSEIRGTASVRSDASLRVNFPGIPFQDANGPVNYRVTYLEDDYSFAIVGDPQRSSGFVLSRTPQIDANRWSQARKIIESRGWWSCTFLTVPMSEGRKDVTPLCAL